MNKNRRSFVAKIALGLIGSTVAVGAFSSVDEKMEYVRLTLKRDGMEDKIASYALVVNGRHRPDIAVLAQEKLLESGGNPAKGTYRIVCSFESKEDFLSRFKNK